ncbi:MAG: MFS transporter [Bryobacteraceae bacterium]
MPSRVFKAFHYRDFRLMWMGACISTIGTLMQQFAQAWVVYKLSGSPFYLGLDSFLGQAPIVLFSLFGGVFADRANRRAILIGSQIIQMTCAFLLTVLFYFQVIQVWHILCLSFVVGFAQSFGGPAYQALIPTLVEPDDLPNAIALNSIQFNLARIIGPVLGGVALIKLTATWCFGLNGISYIAVILSLLVIRPRFNPGRPTTGMLESMREGFRFIRHQPSMGSLLVLAFSMTLLGAPLITFLPVFAEAVFHSGPGTYSELLVWTGAGSVIGALTVAWLGKAKNLENLVLYTLILLGALVAGFALSKSFVLSCALIFFSGAALISAFAMNSSVVQLIVSDQMRGRVMSVYSLAFRGGMPIGGLIVGALIPRFTAPAVLAWNGILLTILGLYFLVMQRREAAL